MKTAALLACLATCVLATTLEEAYICHGDGRAISNASESQVVTQSRKVRELVVVSAIVYARSEIECLVICRNTDRCRTAKFDAETVTCSMYDEDIVFSDINTEVDESALNVQIMKPVSEQNNALVASMCADVCASKVCSNGETCRKDCIGGDAICIGSTADCDSPPVFNIQFWTLRSNWGGTSGRQFYHSFKKKYHWSSIRVVFRGNMRTHGGATTKCSRFFLTFNSQECNNPNKIEFNWYSTTGLNYHRHDGFDGVCHNIPAGTVQIGFNHGTCSGYATANPYTGWSSSTTYIAAEEVDLRETTKLCKSLSVFNLKVHSLRFSEESDSKLIYVVIYQKRDPHTALRVTWSSNLRRTGTNVGSRWWFTFNDTECADPTKIDTVINKAGSDSTSMYMQTTFEGVCYNLPAGPMKIGIHVGPHGSNMNTYTGWTSTTWLTAEEWRLGNDVSAVTFSNGTTMRLPEFNIQHWQWHSINYEPNSGIVKSVTAKKTHSKSYLRIRVRTVYRQQVHGQCSKWWITLSGAACSPHELEGRYYQANDHGTVNDHRGTTFEGICKNTFSSYPATITVNLNVGNCPGYSSGDAYTGYASTTTLTVSEVFPTN